MVHAEAMASTVPLAAPGTSSKSGSPSSSNPEPLMLSEVAQDNYYNNTTNISRLRNSNQNSSPITDPFAQDMTSLVSAAVSSSPATLVPNPDASVGDEQPVDISLLEYEILTTASKTLSSSTLKDSQQQHTTTSNPAGISVSNQTMQHLGLQFTPPGTQTQAQINFDAARKSGIKKSVVTPYQPIELPGQAQQPRIISQQQQGQEASQQMSLQQQAKPVVIWSGIMEAIWVIFT